MDKIIDCLIEFFDSVKIESEDLSYDDFNAINKMALKRIIDRA